MKLLRFPSDRQAAAPALAAVVLAVVAAAGCGTTADRGATGDRVVAGTPAPAPATPGQPATVSEQAVTAGASSTPSAPPSADPAPTVPVPAVPAPTTTTTLPCDLAGAGTTGQTVPITQVCGSQGAPHFDTPDAAMTYLAAAWNAGDVREVDFVSDPAGRAQLDSMAAVMVHLRFKSCTSNPGGDYTCYLMHDVFPSSSPTTYPNPMGYPPGEAVFTVAPATGPGWYLTQVIHCG
jgi:hypothetical protein